MNKRIGMALVIVTCFVSSASFAESPNCPEKNSTEYVFYIHDYRLPANAPKVCNVLKFVGFLGPTLPYKTIPATLPDLVGSPYTPTGFTFHLCNTGKSSGVMYQDGANNQYLFMLDAAANCTSSAAGHNIPCQASVSNFSSYVIIGNTTIATSQSCVQSQGGGNTQKP